jgi:hypothetical protein
LPNEARAFITKYRKAHDRPDDLASFEDMLNAYAAEQTTALRALVDKYREALIWCSGSADFNDGGRARDGWMRICAPLLAAPKVQG